MQTAWIQGFLISAMCTYPASLRHTSLFQLYHFVRIIRNICHRCETIIICFFVQHHQHWFLCLVHGACRNVAVSMHQPVMTLHVKRSNHQVLIYVLPFVLNHLLGIVKLLWLHGLFSFSNLIVVYTLIVVDYAKIFWLRPFKSIISINNYGCFVLECLSILTVTVVMF